jgi:uncharacterized membrane protein YtjA (UPF0391 family)
MLNWAVPIFVIALIAALLGFTGIAVAAAGITKLLFVVFLILFVVSRRPSRPPQQGRLGVI